MRPRRLFLALATAALLLACQIGPRPQPTAEPTSTESVLPTRQTATAAPATSVSVPSIPATAAPSPTSLPTTAATPTAEPGRLPAQPNAGPLPAVWAEIDLGSPLGGVFYPAGAVITSDGERAYVIGRCEPEPVYRDSPPPGCMAEFDLTSDRMVRTAELPGGYDAQMLIAGDTAYLYPLWGGTLYALDADALAMGQVSARTAGSDVMAVAYDGRDTVYAVTRSEIARLSPDAVSRPIETPYDNTAIALAANEHHLFLLGYSTLRLFSPDLQRQGEFDMRDRGPRSMVLDGQRNQAYIGTYSGLWAFDADSMRIFEIAIEDERGERVQNFQDLALDRSGEGLVALVRHPSDWYGGTKVIAIDLANDAPRKTGRTLFSTLSGEFSGLLLDEERNRLLLVSQEDHALLPIDLETGQALPRFPLGTTLQEAVVDPSSGRLFVSDSAGWVHVLDRRTIEPVDRLYGGRQISLDGTHRRLYAGDPRLDSVTAFDADSLEVIWQSEHSGTPRAHPAEDRVVVINRQFRVLDGASGQMDGLWEPGIGIPSTECPGCYYPTATEAYVDAQRGLTMTITYTPWPGKPGPLESVDVDLASGHAYHSLLTGGYVHYSSIGVYRDLGALQKRESPLLRLEGLSGEIRLDAGVRRLYVARGDILFVLDAETLNRVGRVEVDGWQPAIAAIDDEWGRLYSTRDSSLVVWSRTGGAPPAPLPAEPIVLTHTVSSILPSPNYATDLTLLATVNQELVRSTDGGATWERLRGGLPTLGDYAAVPAAAFSPDYANDSTILVGLSVGDTHGEGIYCSTDGGDRWSPCSDGLADLRVTRVVPSPRFAQDRTVLAYSRTDKGESLHRSTNGGKSWELIMRQVSYGTPPLPTPEQVLLIASPLPQFRCAYSGQEGVSCERSADGGLTWQRVDTAQFHMAPTTGAALSPHFADDYFAYWITQNAVFRYNDQTGVGEIATISPLYGVRDYTNGFASIATADLGGGRNRLFIGTNDGVLYSYPADALGWEVVWPLRDEPPAPSPTPTPCAYAPDGRLVADPEIAGPWGCPSAAASSGWMAIQPFERATMLWREVAGETPAGRVTVLLDDGTWTTYEDMWAEGQPDRDPDIKPPEGRVQPVRGFGKVWREQLGGPEAAIGWATEPERGVSAVVQSFQHGLAVRAEDRVFWLADDGTWEQRPAPAGE